MATLRYKGADGQWHEQPMVNVQPYNDASIKASLDLVEKQILTKQDLLKSGENVKTINGESVLGVGDIKVQGGDAVELLDTAGYSTTAGMTQKAITDELGKKANQLDVDLLKNEVMGVGALLDNLNGEVI